MIFSAHDRGIADSRFRRCARRAYEAGSEIPQTYLARRPNYLSLVRA